MRLAILGYDRRTQAPCGAIRQLIGRERVAQLTGNLALPGFTARKILWVRETEPDVYARTARGLLPKACVRRKWTGGVAGDHADGSATVLTDLRKRDGSDEPLACGNPVIVKPSEKVPLTMQLIFRLLEQAGFPPGVVNLVNGAREAVDAILEHPTIRAVSFVGSTPVARHVYSTATANGKRAQCQGGAKNAVVIMPDAEMDMATKIVADSAFGCAGQRCLAVSLAITVGEARESFTPLICEAASTRVVGNGLDAGVQTGPVISAASKERIEGLIGKGQGEGASVVVDGRGARIKGCEGGSFVRPTVLTDVPPKGEVAKTEIFGPVLGMMPVATLDEAIDYINGAEYGNQASIFTASGTAARRFRYEAQAGNIGINIGVAAPMAFFPFSV